jgi:LPS-assembly protein
MWKLQVDDLPQTSWRLKANINALSDQYMLRDFYQNLYESNAEPDNTIAVERTSRTSALTLLQRMPLNDFYITDQRTELSYDHIRTPLFGSRIAYESQTSIGWMRQVVPAEMRASIRSRLDQMSPASESRDFWERMLVTDGFFRFHTYHELSTTAKVAKVINLTPKVGAGYTGYMDSTGDLGTFNQWLAYAGVEANVKFSKNYSSVQCDWLGLDGLNHIIQPYVTMMYLGADALNTTYPMIDGNSSTTNPMALDVGQMSDIDSMSTRSICRYGVKNFLMTQRDGGPARWMTWDLFMDAYLHNTDSDNDFSNLYSMMSWSPLPWFSYASTVQFPLLGDNKKDNYREYNNSMSFQPFKPWEITVGHRYLEKHPILSDSNQLTLRTLYRLTEETAISGYWRWELERHRMEIQELNLYKNMGSWYLGLGVYTRKNGNKNELGIGFSFTLMETGTYMPFKFN